MGTNITRIHGTLKQTFYQRKENIFVSIHHILHASGGKSDLSAERSRRAKYGFSVRMVNSCMFLLLMIGMVINDRPGSIKSFQ